MNTWLPKLMIQAGYSLSSSLLFVAMMNVGAIVGTIALDLAFTDKLGFKKVMIPLYVCGAIALASIGLTQNAVLAYILIGFIGASSVGVQNISNAMVSQYYPPSMRSSGVGASMAFGRLGGIFAPTFVGILLTMNLPAQMNFSLIAIAAVVGAIAIAFVQEKHAHYSMAGEGQPKGEAGRLNHETRGCLISPYSSEFRKNKEAEMLLNQRFCLLLFIQFRGNYTFWDSP